MALNLEQRVNLLAIELLELYGILLPTQQQIDYVEAFLRTGPRLQTKAQ